MERKRTLPAKNLLPRANLNRLLQKGLESSLITVIAGPGYGKTQAVAAFVQDIGKRVIWCYLSSLDNDETRFWETFTNAMMEDLPKLASVLRSFGFPDTGATMDAFLRVFTREIYGGDQVVLVVDDYHKIQNRSIKVFFQQIMESRLENFTLIIISSERADFNVSGLRNNVNLYSITMEDLRFSVEETQQLFEQNDILLSDAEAVQLVKNTEGWPLALYLLTTHHRGKDSAIFQAEAILPLYAELFENLYFIDFPEEIRTLLIKVSQFESFFPEMIRDIGGCNLEEAVQSLALNVFLVYDHTLGQFIFHKMYREFLQKKLFLIEPAELERVMLIAAECFSRNGRLFEAINCYRNCGRYTEMWQAILEVPRVRKSRNAADFMLECIHALPDEQQYDPEVMMLTSLLYLNNADVNEATNMLLHVANTLESDEKTKTGPVLGEAYATLGDISIIKNTLDFFEYFKKAYELIPNGSVVRNPELMFIGNNNSVFLPDSEPGSLDRTVQLVMDAVPYMEAISNGSGHGFEYLFAGEAALLVYDLGKAKELAYQAIHKASLYSQHDIICNAHYLLMRIFFAYGDYYQAAEQMETVKLYINSKNLVVLFEMRDCIESSFYFSMGDSGQVSRWFLEKDYAKANFTISSGRDKLFYAYYYMSMGDYVQPLAILNNLEELFAQKGLWYNRLSHYIIRTECHYRNGDFDRATEMFRQAYDMTWQNNIITPFVALGNTMRSIIDMVRKRDGEYFDKVFLDGIYHKASAYAKRFASVVKEYNKQTNKAQPEGLKPTKRELEVLAYLAQGLTREEIGDTLKISINGVKKHITSIYNKLGAINRADAIHIAISRGYIS